MPVDPTLGGVAPQSRMIICVEGQLASVLSTASTSPWSMLRPYLRRTSTRGKLRIAAEGRV